ncbi:MAG TPA: ribose-5-phosphate isomerase RpiA [Trueperaceae bacterium]|nr:ribose-5-phosphate isomerase RpiA [Trueperaceae bacterium]
MDPIERLKRDAARRALELVEPGMLVGLGSGSTAHHFIAGLGARLAAGALAGVRAVASSRESESQALELGIPLIDLPAGGIDLAVDGMDEVSPTLDAIKGLGGALTREKIVAAAARRFVLVGDGRKRVDRLGQRAPVPVEIIAFGWRHTRERLRALGADPRLRGGEADPYTTDNGNLILDLAMPGPFDPRTLADALCGVPGVVEHGLFLGMAERAFVAEAGGVAELSRTPA